MGLSAALGARCARLNFALKRTRTKTHGAALLRLPLNDLARWLAPKTWRKRSFDRFANLGRVLPEMPACRGVLLTTRGHLLRTLFY